ncbi:MAG: methyltransferase domain-containing protein [Anaerolineae bacterium]|nr:methyltransferase domain-containing protein [Anaerolineae bacterium]
MSDPARDHLRLMQHLFNDAAARHVDVVEPVLAPLYDDFMRYAAPSMADRVLDVGAGTGPIARRIAPDVQSVLGVDVAIQSLLVACAQNGLTPLPPLSIQEGRGGNRAHRLDPAHPDNANITLITPQRNKPDSPSPSLKRGPGGEVSFTHADLHRLPIPAHTFTLITASFGLNAADPHRAWRELRRVIAPGGRIVIQEWGPVTKLDQIVRAVLADFRVTDPPPDLAALREWLARDLAERQWTDVLQDADDYAEWLTDLGFAITDSREVAPVTIPVNIAAFMAYALAGTDRDAELRAMDTPTRTAFTAALRARLGAFVDADGVLHYQPIVIRAIGCLPN